MVMANFGTFEGAIFQNWHFGPWNPDGLPSALGLDFGWADPDACSRIAIDHKNKIIYADELIYKSGNSFDQLRQMLQYNIQPRELLIYDSADARMGNELRHYFNAIPINKKLFNISDALKMMQSYEIIITEKSKNLARELSNYAWHDKKAGIPAAGFDHLIDGIRYVFMNMIARLHSGGLRRMN